MLKEFLTASNKLHVPRYLLGRVLVFPSTVINLLKAVYSHYIYIYKNIYIYSFFPFAEILRGLGFN